jgi:hypothetical protein
MVDPSPGINAARIQQERKKAEDRLRQQLAEEERARQIFDQDRKRGFPFGVQSAREDVRDGKVERQRRSYERRTAGFMAGYDDGYASVAGHPPAPAQSWIGAWFSEKFWFGVLGICVAATAIGFVGGTTVQDSRLRWLQTLLLAGPWLAAIPTVVWWWWSCRPRSPRSIAISEQREQAKIETEIRSLLPLAKSDDIARMRIIQLLEILGPENPKTNAYRKALAAALY